MGDDERRTTGHQDHPERPEQFFRSQNPTSLLLHPKLRMGVFLNSARAMLILCRSPPESCEPRSPTTESRPLAMRPTKVSGVGGVDSLLNTSQIMNSLARHDIFSNGFVEEKNVLGHKADVASQSPQVPCP
jgi:hypothetical protein